MSRKILVKLIAASFALVGVESAMACSITAWTNTGAGGGATGAPLAGEPDDLPTPVARYAGRCALRSPTDAPAFVRDVSPAAEPKYRARFYVYTGLTGGEAVVFRAVDSTNAPKIRVSYDNAAGAFRFFTGADATADATVNGVVANRWYNVELSFSNAAPVELRYTVRGNGSDTPLANDLAITTGIAGTDVIDSAELGFVAAGAVAPAGAVTTDAFESRRNTAIGALCRGDSTGDRTINIFDVGTVVNERVNGTLAAGQPDCTEDGVVNIFDVGCVVQRRLAGATCS